MKKFRSKFPPYGSGSGQARPAPEKPSTTAKYTQGVGKSNFNDEARLYPHSDVTAPKPVKNKAPHVPVESKDNLFTHQWARMQDVICEGPIDGLCYPNGKKLRTSAHNRMALYFDEVAVQNTDGSLNISGVNFGFLQGTQDQLAISGFSKAVSMVQVGLPMKYNRPVVAAISNPDAVSVEVAVRVLSLVSQNKDNGDIDPYEVKYKIEVSRNGGGYVLLENVTVKGKATQPYVRSKAYTLPRSSANSTTDSWNIRATRLSKDDSTAYKQSETLFDFVNVVNKGSFAYPLSSIATLEIDAAGFQSVPLRGYHVRLLQVKVPSNYFPESRQYNRDKLTGAALTVEDTDPLSETFGLQIPDDQVWDGTFYTAWTDNPAWCFYDLVTNKRYGLGDVVPSSAVDKWSLYTIARYCDVLVDDGEGGEEPRFTCNVYIQTAEEAYKVIQDFASVFRGMVYWAGGSLVAVQDSPKVPRMVFTDANVVGGQFVYTGTSSKTRYTVAIVRWSDPEENYKPKYVYVEDPVGIIEYGYNEIQPVAFATTSEGQARRLGRYTLLTELNETNTVAFVAGTEAIGLRPGDVVVVMDTKKAGAKNGGRILSIASDRLSFTVDRAMLLNSDPATVVIALPRFVIDTTAVTSSETVSAPPMRETYNITNLPVSGTITTNTVSVSAPLAAGIVAGAVWASSTTEVSPQYFRIINISEKDKGTYSVEAVQYFEGKYEAAENNTPLEEPDITALSGNPVAPPPVTYLLVTRNVTGSPQAPVLKFVLTWERATDDAATLDFKVEFRRNSDPWAVFTRTANTMVEIGYTLKGTYEFKVTAIGRFGVNSEAVLVDMVIEDIAPIQLYLVTGLELVGADLQGQGADTSFIGKDARFQWRLNSPSAPLSLGGDDETETGVGLNGEDPYFQDFEFSVWDVTSNQRVFSAITKEPGFSYTEDMNRQSTGAPAIGRNQFTVKVVGRNKWGDTTVPAVLTVQNPAPQPPTNLQAFPAFSAVWLKWSNPADIDFDYVNIYQGSTNVFANAVKIGHQKGDTLFRGALLPSQTYYFWVEAVDTFGTKSAPHPANGVSTTTASVVATDIADFSVKATRMFTKTVILDADVWTNNNPSAGSISWNAHVLVYNGAKYNIVAGNTADAFIIWRNGATAYETTAVHPTEAPVPLGVNDFIIATNTDGVHDLAWNGVANQVIGSAYIMNAAINDAHIASLSADKIFAGTISGQEVVIGLPVFTEDAVWANNSPSAGSVSWDSHTLDIGGSPHSISSGETALPYIIWRFGATSYVGSSIQNMGAGDLLIGRNATGTFVSSGQGQIRSENYSEGVSGWNIKADGTAEFNNLIVRESLSHDTVYQNTDFPGKFFISSPRMAQIDHLSNHYSGYVSYDANSPALEAEEGYVVTSDPSDISGESNTLNPSPVAMTYNDGTIFAAERALHRIHWLGHFSTTYSNARTSPFFIGTGVVSSLVGDDWNMGREASGLNYRRLGRAGFNRFNIKVRAEVLEYLSVFFIVAPAVGNDEAIGNVYTPLQYIIDAAVGAQPPTILLGGATLPWNYLGTIRSPKIRTARYALEFVSSCYIFVPEDHIIFFGVGSLGQINLGLEIGDDIIQDISWDICADNTGEIGIAFVAPPP